ncbi:hypothetical protein [Peptoniphilus genitalis]|uniref:hypothetical protein n=1 Tax=Peptoniphilus genitalis TaxID=3036303 RepID=UPI0024ACF79F|nr:hypothetical protein [Peptoniphilus sp. Marseille-Q7072]
MIVSGSRGILFYPVRVQAVKYPDYDNYDIIAENRDYSVTLYENVPKAKIENIMRKIAFQIKCQVLKDED